MTKNAIMDDEDALRADLERRQNDEYCATRTALGGDSEFTERLAAFRAEFPDIKANMAEEIFDFLADKGWMRSTYRGGGSNAAFMVRVLKMFNYLNDHFNRNAFYALLHIWDEPAFDDINGNLTQTQFADKMYPSKHPTNPAKAAVNNAVKDAQRYFGTKPRRDQRSDKACATMSQKTIERLERKK
jgi:hypothetical protein